MPDDPVFVSAVSGALLELTRAYNWEQSGTLTPAEQAAAFDAVYMSFVDSVCIEASDLIYPKTFMAFGQVAKMAGAGAVQSSYLVGTQFGQFTRVVTPYINNEYGVDVLLAKGNWLINYTAISNNSSGQVRLRLNGADTIFLNEYYSAAQVLNLTSNNTQTVVVPTDGIHKVGFKMVSKHAASSNYNFFLQAVWGVWVSALP